MTRETARPRRSRSAVLVFLAAAAIGGCSSFVEVPIETPLQSKLDVGTFRRVLIAGFVTRPGESEIELGSETARLLQNQLRSSSRLQVLEPDRPPLADALDKVRAEDRRRRQVHEAAARAVPARGRQDPARSRILAEARRGVPEPADRHRQARLREPEPLRLRSPTSGCADPAPTAASAGCAATATSSARASSSTPTSCSSTAAPAPPCTRRSSPKRCSTVKTRRPRRSAPTSS